MLKDKVLSLLVIALVLVIMEGCKHHTLIERYGMQSSPTKRPALLWRYRVKGGIKQVAICADGRYVLCIPSRAGFGGNPFPVYISREGRVLWEYKREGLYYHGGISTDGKIIAFIRELGEHTSRGWVLTVINKKGKVLLEYKVKARGESPCISSHIFPPKVSSDGKWVSIRIEKPRKEKEKELYDIGIFDVKKGKINWLAKDLAKRPSYKNDPVEPMKKRKPSIVRETFDRVTRTLTINFYSPKGKKIASQQLVRNMCPWWIEVSSSGQRVLCTGQEPWGKSLPIYLFDEKGNLVWKFWRKEAPTYYGANMSEDGNFIVLSSMGEQMRIPIRNKGEIYYLDNYGRESWRHTLPTEIEFYYKKGIALSHNGRYLAVATRDGDTYFFDCWGSDKPPKAKPGQKPLQ